MNIYGKISKGILSKILKIFDKTQFRSLCSGTSWACVVLGVKLKHRAVCLFSLQL